MPELPEVETIARALRSGGVVGEAVPGRRIRSACFQWARTLAEPGVDEAVERLVGQTIEAVGRRGKFLVLDLSKDKLLIHLRMSGDIRVEPAFQPDGVEVELRPHDRAVFWFDDGGRMVFNDARKFGRIWLTDDPGRITGGLGLEPFDEALTAGRFHAMLMERKRQLKPLLLDQSFLAGLGNIYTDEALHLAKLHPLRLSSSLSGEQSARLLNAVRQVLEWGIQSHGASIDWVYRGGEFQNHFRAYQRTGLPCVECGALLERIVVGQRGTHFCPVCQPHP